MRAQAAALAQQDQARLRGLTITQLAANCSGTCPAPPATRRDTTAVNGTTYTITSTSKYISGTGASPARPGSRAARRTRSPSPRRCRGRTTASARRSSSTASSRRRWAARSSRARRPLDPTGSTGLVGLAGVTVTPTGPSTVSPLTTDSDGCAIFGGLSAGSYTVSFTPPTGYVDVNGNTTIANQTPTVTATQSSLPDGRPARPARRDHRQLLDLLNNQTVTNQGDQFSVQNPALSPAPHLRHRQLRRPTHASPHRSAAGRRSTRPSRRSRATTSRRREAASTRPRPVAGQASVAGHLRPRRAPVTLPEPAMIILPYTSAGRARRLDLRRPVDSATHLLRHQLGTGRRTPADYGGTETESTDANATDA